MMDQFLAMNFGLIPIPPVPEGVPEFCRCSKPVGNAICGVCGAYFTRTGMNHKHCSPECTRVYRNIKYGKTCKFCGKEYKPAKQTSIYCSKSCATKANLN